MASYAAVETALARMHGADAEAQKGAFRGRIKHLQRLGLPLGEKPGKGKRIDYTDQQIWQFALGLELSQFGIDPSVIAKLIIYFWDDFFFDRLCKQSVARSHEGAVLTIPVSLMSASWMPPSESMDGLIAITWVDRNYTIGTLVGPKRPRVIVIDTWRMLRDVQRHLKDIEEQ